MEYREKFYYLGLLLTLVGLSFSNAMISNGLVILGAVWLFDISLKQKLKLFSTNITAISISLIYVIHIFGLIYTSDFSFATNDLKTKLPLLVFPLVMSSAPALSKHKIRFFLLVFSFAVLASYSSALFIYLTKDLVDTRDAFIFVSHIRLSLEAVISIFIFTHFAFSKKYEIKTWFRTSLVISAFLLLWFMMILGQISGILIGSITSILVFSFFVFIKLETRWKFISAFLMLLIMVLGFLYIKSEATRYNSPIAENQKTKTLKGNIYEDKRTLYPVENGRYIGANICWQEMEEAWEIRSGFNFNEKTGNGNSLPETLLRYLNSRGLSKDYSGVMLLTEKDVRNIEAGFANFEYTKKFSLRKRLYKILWEYSIYKINGMVDGNSIVQRIVLWETGLKIFKLNPIFGVGTGDIAMEFKSQLNLENSPLKDSNLRSHNNFLSYLVSFGIFGLLIILLLIIYPILKFKLHNNYLFMVFIFAYLVSMLWEDTMETQVGITIFAFLYSFFAVQRIEYQTKKLYFDDVEEDIQ